MFSAKALILFKWNLPMSKYLIRLKIDHVRGELHTMDKNLIFLLLRTEHKKKNILRSGSALLRGFLTRRCLDFIALLLFYYSTILAGRSVEMDGPGLE